MICMINIRPISIELQTHRLTQLHQEIIRQINPNLPVTGFKVKIKASFAILIDGKFRIIALLVFGTISMGRDMYRGSTLLFSFRFVI